MTTAPSSSSPSPREVKVTGIDYQGVFEFLHLFKGFRLAINPAKIVIGLLAILLIYCSGLAFDLAWGPQVYEQEVENYQNFSADGFRSLRERRSESRQQDLASALSTAGSGPDSRLSFSEAEVLSHSPRAAYRALRRMYEAEFRAAVATAAKERATEETIRSGGFGLSSQSPAETERLEKTRAAQILKSRMSSTQQIVGKGIVESFINYEKRQFDALVDNSLSLARISQIRPTNPNDLEMLDDRGISTGLISRNSSRLFRSDNVVGCLANMVYTGPAWLISGSAPTQWRPKDATAGWGGTFKMVGYRGIYWLSLVALLAFWMVVLALAGGIISRLSALEFAGYDKSGLWGIFRFVKQRLGTFIKAPLMPLGILLILGVAVMLLSLVGAIPFIGEILLGLMFIIILALGFIMMLLTLGMLGGMNLLYPTIATEGSDNFDAMSRGFAYVYARPWRLIAYNLISLLYGVITFVFITLVVYLMLGLTHVCAVWGTSLFGYNQAWLAGGDKLNVLWPAPKFALLFPEVNWWALSWSEWIGAGLIQGWLCLLLAAMGGYVMSYYYSANTIIYFLLRRSVDGQGLCDILPPEDEPKAPETKPEMVAAETPPPPTPTA